LLKVLKASERAKHLVKQILTFSRQGNPQRVVTSIAPIIHEVLDLLRASIPSSIVIESDLQNDTKPVLADGTKIHEVLLNLATNSVHAMNGKGTLTIQLHSVLLDVPTYGLTGEMPDGEYTVIEVADTGCGMDASTLSKAFDPFFTTKPVGEGTGMGLSVVLGVVQSIGGDIIARSNVGEGTTIQIYLPVSESAEAAQHHDHAGAVHSGTERILFVDDEEMLVEMNVDWLSSLGYIVVARSDSREALDYIRRHKNAIDLLITDQTMPVMTGSELARAALAIRADLPIILCTGFSTETDSDQAAAIGIKGFLMKPYRSDEMSRMIRDVLDKKTNIHA
jgi:CheY-like chemotaxis protein